MSIRALQRLLVNSVTAQLVPVDLRSKVSSHDLTTMQARHSRTNIIPLIATKKASTADFKGLQVKVLQAQKRRRQAPFSIHIR